MRSSGIRAMLIAGIAAVCASWTFDALRSGMSTGSTTVAIGLIVVLGLLVAATYLIDRRAARHRSDRGPSE